MGQNDNLIRIQLSVTFWERLLRVLVVVACAVLAYWAFGALAAIAATLGALLTTLAVVGMAPMIISVVIPAAASGINTVTTKLATVYANNDQYPNDLVLPIYSISPEEIFKGQILLLDIDFFNPVEEVFAQTDKVDSDGNVIGDGNPYSLKTYPTDEELNEALADDERVRNYYYIDENGQKVITSKQNTSLDLQQLVSQWYSAIRNIAIVLSMSVLLYIGIRMMLSTVAQDKAKYKQMLMDWLVGICLLFFMHYIMAFSISIVKELTKVLTITNTEENGYAVVLELDEAGKIEKKVKELGLQETISNGTVVWPTNLMGQLRIQAQLSYGDASFIGYGLCYFILVLLTIFYIFIYLKRVLYMAFLTMIAPLVALTYPIDKINDGQAQAFNKWLKEYIFNLLIQPLHLLIYTVLVTSAFDLAGKNPIYAIVAIAFLIPAEKLMRSLFGFEKASTPGSLAAAAVGGSLMNQGLQKLLHRGPSGSKGDSGKDGNDSDSNNTLRTAYKEDSDPDNIDEVADGIRTNNIEGAEDDAETPRQIDLPQGSDMLAGNSAILNLQEGNNREEQGNNGNDGNDGNTTISTPGIRMANTSLQNSRSVAPQVALNMAGRAKRKIKKRALGAGQALRTGGKSFARKYTSNLKSGLRKTPKAVAGALAGTVAGGIALGAAVATGDPSNALTWTAGATAAGATLGAKATNSLGGPKSATRIAMEQAFWGDEYEKREAEKNQKKWKRDSENKAALEKYLGEKEAKKLYENKDVDKFLKQGVTDPKVMAAMVKAMQKDGSNFNEICLANEARNSYGNGKSRLTGKVTEELTKDYAEQFEKRGVSSENAKRNAEKIVDRVNLINKIYSDL